MAANVLAYFAEGEGSMISRSTARCQVPGARAKGSGWGLGTGAGGGPQNSGLMRTPRAWFMGFNPDLAPSA